MTELFGVPLEVVSTSWTGEALAELEEATASPLVAIGIVVFESDTGPAVAEGLPGSLAGSWLQGPDPELSEHQGFAGKPGQVMTLLSPSAGPATVYLGCGKSDE